METSSSLNYKTLKYFKIEMFYIFIDMSFRCITEGLIDGMSALVQMKV